MANSVFEYFVPMRDGVKLYTTLQMPEAEGKFPIVIIRSPYSSGRSDLESLAQVDTHGYAVVQQQCRGTACSEGECNAYINERNDGLDLLDWVRKLPCYNGELFLSGGSYLSSVHLSYLDTNPEDIKAAFLAVQDSERYNILYRHGFYKSGLHGKWVVVMHKRNQKIERNCSENTFRTMPLAGVTETIFNERVPYIEEEFLHPDPSDEFWKTPAGGRDYSHACEKCDIPIFLVTSFYDIYTEGVFDMWRNLSPERKENCALLVTPFDHAYNPLVENIKEEMQDFRDGLLREIAPDFEYAWFDHIRLGKPLPFAEKGKSTYYRLWDNKWLSALELKNAPQERCFYLTQDRALSELPAEKGEITYTYNPYDPASFKGGVCNNFDGMKYQDAPNSRYDIVSFLSEPLKEDIICEGKIEVDLYCRSTAEDTCFYVRLDFERDGKTLSLRDDIDSLCRTEKTYTPGTERKLHFVFAPHAFKLRAGDRLRLDVSSSCVPYFQVHSNYPGLQALQTVAKSSRNTVITGLSQIKIHCF